MTPSGSKTIAIVGGGLAGLAAGCALSSAGYRVTLFERKPYLGGRASSYEHPGTGEVVDNCQHVLLGCCTNLLGFYQRIGAENLVRWYDRLNFIEPGGRCSVIGPSGLPAPLHNSVSFALSKCFSIKDKAAIARALLSMLRAVPVDDGKPFIEWLKAHGQTSNAIERFWKVVLVSSLNEDLDRLSTATAAMVFRESFLKSAGGGRMGVPRVPLTELYSRAGDYIVAHGGSIELRAAVEQIEPVGQAEVGDMAQGIWASRAGVRLCVAGKPRMFDHAVLAVPFNAVAKLIPERSESEALRNQLCQFDTSPITGVHLWFDRQITELDHAVLLDRTIQWMFQKSRILDRYTDSAGNGKRETGNSYIELVISASKTLVEKSRQEVIDLCVRELGEFFPVVKQAELVKATVVKEIHATHAPVPGLDAHRPTPASPWPQIFLAGDWIATGWPATMEGAVRSGYLAAEALCAAAGRSDRFLLPGLPASGLMRFAK